MAKTKPNQTTALYCRLSRDDEHSGDSNSIVNHPEVKLKLTLF